WCATGRATGALDEAPGLVDVDVVVDALLGIGLARAPQGPHAQAIEAINRAGRPVLALDVPSGLDADRGAVPGVAVRADRTICFIAHKRGLVTGRARACCGDVELAPLGVGDAAFEVIPVAARLVNANALARWLQPRARDAHKGRHGHVLALGCEPGYGGALRLCAQAALRSGAGYVVGGTLGAPC